VIEPEPLEVLVRLGIGAAVIGLMIVVSLVLKGIDRKFAAWLQARYGPPVRQPFYDMAKLFQKENVVPERAVPWAFNGAPLLALVASLALLLFVPIGPAGGIVEDFVPLLHGYGDLVLIVYLLAVPGLMMSIGGFASGSPLATVGAQREMVMMMSYEFPLAIVVLGLAWRISSIAPGADSFSMVAIVENPLWGEIGFIGVIGLSVLAIVFFLIIPSELSKIPFDAPEAETEIGGGIIAEYSGSNLAMFYLADAVKSVAFAALAIALFVPYDISPVLGWDGVAAYAVDLLFWLIKIELLYFVAITVIRVGAARLKIDRLSWLYLVPLSALAVVGVLLLYLDTVRW